MHISHFDSGQCVKCQAAASLSQVQWLCKRGGGGRTSLQAAVQPALSSDFCLPPPSSSSPEKHKPFSMVNTQGYTLNSLFHKTVIMYGKYLHRNLKGKWLHMRMDFCLQDLLSDLLQTRDLITDKENSFHFFSFNNQNHTILQCCIT